MEKLDKADIRQFGEYVQSPFFNKSKKLIRLAKYLRELYPEFPERKLEKEKVFKVIYGEKPYNEQQVHDQMSLLTRLMEGYLAQKMIDQKPEEKYFFLLEGLADIRDYDHHQRIFEKAETELGENMSVPRHFLYLHRIQQQTESFTGQLKNRGANRLLQDQMTHLDIYFLGSKLRATCEMLNRKNIVNAEYYSEMEDEILSYLSNPQNPYLNVPFIAIYFRIYLTLREPLNEDHYQELVVQLKKHAGKFTRTEAYTMYAFAQNYCIRKINRGDSQYLNELFLVYKQLLKDEILLESGVLAHEHYKNITTVGLRLKEFDWVEEFLQQYKENLNTEVRENAWNYNLCVFYYEKGQYKEAMKLLQRVEFTDVYYQLSAKSILLKIYYELGDDDSLRYHILAFRAFLKRNRKISKFHSEGHQNLLKMVSKVARVRRMKPRLEDDEFTRRREGVIQTIHKAGNIPNANWLRQQAAVL